MSLTDVVDLAFPVLGESVALDHGYALYGAVCATLPELHGTDWLGIHPLDGEPVGDGSLHLRKGSRLKLRIPAPRIPEVLPLAGKRLLVGGRPLQLRAPVVTPLLPAASLDARCVHVRLTTPPRADNAELGRPTLDTAKMAEAAQLELERQLAELGVSGRIALHGKRTISVAGQRLVGFSVRVSGLDGDGSLLLQARGLGGKRAMGCGIFRPTKRRGKTGS